MQGEEEFASVEVIDRQSIHVRWFGEPTAQMQDLIDRFLQLDITVDQVACSPGHGLAFGDGSFQTDPNVRSFSLKPDGSSAIVMLDEPLGETSDISDLERQYSEAADCPIRVSADAALPPQSHADQHPRKYRIKDRAQLIKVLLDDGSNITDTGPSLPAGALPDTALR